LLPSKKEILIGAGAVLAGVVVLALLARYGKQAGAAAGEGVGNFVGGAAVGAVFGLGNALGLPDTRDAQVLAEGRAAFAAGRYFEASQKLPLPEYFALVRDYWRNRFTAAPNDQRDATAGAGSVTNGDEGSARLAEISPFLI
jgi:hypothetical protein